MNVERKIYTSDADKGFPTRQISDMLQLQNLKKLAIIVQQLKNWSKRKLNALTMKVSLKEANMRATPKTCSPSLTAGPRVTFSSFGSLTFLLDYTTIKIKAKTLSELQLYIPKQITESSIYCSTAWDFPIYVPWWRASQFFASFTLLLLKRKWWQR